MTQELQENDRAPDFELADAEGTVHRLSDYRGQPVVLVFYPMDFSGVCTEEHSCVLDVMPRLNQLEAQVLGISVDHKHAHKAFAAANGIEYPLLSDFQPRGAVGALYGAFDEEAGFNRRWTFIVDPDGRISHIQRNQVGEVPDMDEIVEAVEEAT
ncbi:MAG: redoxin domain-containing protein [Anaerolineae bacterium]